MPEQNPNNLNKEAIAARMFRHGARHWGYKDSDIDNFDPVVRLLIEACAVELYKINNEIAAGQGQMLEKLARLLTPEVHTAPKPAHAVLHARSVEPDSQIYPDMQLFLQKKVASKPNGPLDSSIDVFFSPAGNYRVVDGDIKYIAAGADLYAIKNWQFKETFLKAVGGKRFPPRTLWLGIELNHLIKDLSGLSFFFDLKNQANKWQLLRLLPYAKWQIDDKPVETLRGLWNPVKGDVMVDTFSGFDEFNINQSLARHVNEYYQDHFITIFGKDGIGPHPVKFPPDFEKVFSASELKKIPRELVWVKIEFLAEFDESVLDDLTASINSFPVGNRHLNEIRYRLQTNINIIPLLSTGQFLSIENVEGDESEAVDGRNKYTEHPVGGGALTTRGTYSLRRGDIERFDSSNATEYLNYLIELLRDESGAFAALGQDFVASLVRELNQNITQLEQKVKQNGSNQKGQQTYLLINPRREGETIFVTYWSTDGDLGNFIRSGSKLELYSGSDLQPETIVMITNSTGGSDRLKDAEILNAYQNTLITRGRIVTSEDIKSFCLSILGDKVKNVKIGRGVAISTLPHEGLINTVEIILTPSVPPAHPGEWNDDIRDLLVRLDQQSAMMSNYRISIAAV